MRWHWANVHIALLHPAASEYSCGWAQLVWPHIMMGSRCSFFVGPNLKTCSRTNCCLGTATAINTSQTSGRPTAIHMHARTCNASICCSWVARQALVDSMKGSQLSPTSEGTPPQPPALPPAASWHSGASPALPERCTTTAPVTKRSRAEAGVRVQSSRCLGSLCADGCLNISTMYTTEPCLAPNNVGFFLIM